MATPFDPSSVFPPFYDAPDPSTLQWPWSQPAPDPAAAAPPPVPPPVEVAPPPGPTSAPAPDLAVPPPPPPITELPSAQAAAVPDALSNVDFSKPLGDLASAYAPTRAPGELPEAQYAGAAQKLATSPIDPATGDIRADVSDEDAQRYINGLAQRDPAAFAELSTKLEGLKTKRAIAEHAKIVERDYQQQVENNKIRTRAIADAQKKSEALVADATRLANMKEDPSGGVHGGRLVAGALASFIGGFNKGGPNYGMQALDSAIANGIAAQRADMANQRELLGIRKGALAEEYARHGDEFQAAETVRLAALKHADDLLATEQQNYSPRGTTFMKIANLRAQIGAAQQKSIEEHAQKSFENGLKLQTAAREQQLADEAARNNRAQLGLGYARLRSDEEDRKLQRQIHAQDKADAAAAKAQEQRDKQVLERSFGGEIVTNPDGSQGVGPLTMKDGSVFIAKGPEGHVNALRKKHDAAVTLERTLNEIRRIGPEWLSDTANSDKFQRLHQLMGDARLQAIAAKDLGVPTGHDIELAEAFLGTSDATRRKDSIAGLVQARTSLIRDHNVELQNAGLDKPWSPPDTSTLPSAPATFRATSTEQGEAAKPGALARALFTPLGVEHGTALDPTARAEEAAKVGPTGLATQDTAQVADTIKAASSAPPAARAALVDKLAAWAQSPRESVANGVLGLIRGESPALYNEVLAKLPEGQRDALPDFASLPLPGRDLPPLPARKGGK